MKKIICLILAVLMATFMISCNSQKVDEPLVDEEQQNTEDVVSSENTSNEEETTNTPESTGTAESTGSGDSDNWTGIY